MFSARRFARGAGTLLLLAGFLVVLFPFMTEAYGRHRQQVLREDFESKAVQASKGTAPQKGAQADWDSLPFRLVIPQIWVDAVVKEGVNGKSLATGPVHYPGTALPGGKGNCVVFGHRTTYGSPFHWLDRLKPGDGIAAQTLNGWIWYVVEEVKIIPESDLGQAIFWPTDTRLSLFTCNPLFSARERLVVVAKPENPSPEAKEWGILPPPKRTRQSMQGTTEQEFSSPFLTWLRELAKQEGRPAGLDSPTGPSGPAAGQEGKSPAPPNGQSNALRAPTPAFTPSRGFQAPTVTPPSETGLQSPKWQGNPYSAGQNTTIPPVTPASGTPSSVPSAKGNF
jgi:sortase A